MDKYIPPSKKNTIKSYPPKIDIANNELFPSLIGTVNRVTQTTENWSSIIKEDDIIEHETLVDEDIVPLAYKHITSPTILIRWDNYTKKYIECPRVMICDTIVNIVDELLNDIIRTSEKRGYAFNNHLVVKKRILHWLFKIETMKPSDIWVDFKPNYWIIKNSKLRREEDLRRFMDIFSVGYWNSIYQTWRASNDWFFNTDCNKGEMMCNDFPYMIYSCLDLEHSEITHIITDEIYEEEEEEARCIALSQRYRNMIENGEDYSDIIKQIQNEKIERDNLRGDRRHDLW